MTITVAKGSVLSNPNPAKRLPGIIEIFGERIEYYKRDGNVLSQLRRGTLGTGVRLVYEMGTLVQDIGKTETIPYRDTTYTEQYTTLSTWKSSLNYELNDVVSYNGRRYVCSTAHTSTSVFESAKWTDTGSDLTYTFKVMPTLDTTTVGLNSTWYRKTTLVSKTAQEVEVDNYYVITKLGTSDFRAVGAPANQVGVKFRADISNVPAGNFVVGNQYSIVKIGITDWAEVGVTGTPTVGTVFTATSAGRGNGRVRWIKGTTGTGTLNLVTYQSIPSTYGQANDIEMFVGGYDVQGVWIANLNYNVGDIVVVGSYNYRCVTVHTSSESFIDDINNWEYFTGNIRLSKVPYKVHNVRNHYESPEGDVQFEPEFSVDGITSAVRLTNRLTEGTKITLVKRTGTVWADLGASLAHSSNPIAKFIRDK
jgi:hypothetical protein